MNIRTQKRPIVATIFAVVASSLLIVACRHTSTADRPVPKPEGHPRIEIPAPLYTLTDISGIALHLNTAALVSLRPSSASESSPLDTAAVPTAAPSTADPTATPSSTWLDVTYPTFPGSRIYLTLLHVATPSEMDAALANRIERMQLNTGGSPTELIELTSDGGWQCQMAVTRSSLTTPIQILARSDSRLLSGALYLDYPPETQPDSVAPIVDTVRRDLIHTLKHLSSTR